MEFNTLHFPCNYIMYVVWSYFIG